MAERVALRAAGLDVWLAGPASSAVTVAAAHPVDGFGAETAELLATVSGARVACFDLRADGEDAGVAPALEQLADRLESARPALGLGRWVFWGMSGGGWLALLLAHRHPDAVRGVVIESACPCFRERLADPECVLSPLFPAWRARLGAAGLLAGAADTEPGAAAGDTEWVALDGLGDVFRRRGGPALLVSPGPTDAAIKSAMPRLWEFDARPWIGSLRVPALVVCGTADPLLPVRHARAVHDAIAGSSLVEVLGGGHVPTTERRPEVEHALRSFLTAVERGPA